jgi:hypothetical protein
MPRRDEDEYDDDHDRPRRRRRRDEPDDDEYDDRPRRRRRPAKGGGTPVLVIVAVAAIGTLVLCGGLGVVLFPAVQKVREAADRTKDQNNLKQIGLGMHVVHDFHGRLTVPLAYDPDRKRPARGLSFRVGLLPYVEQGPLYARFDLTQPWDAGPNREPAAADVPAYRDPLDPPGSAVTPYRAFVGGGALFEEDGREVRIADVTDGMSNTIMAAHAAEPVRWAEPRELRYDPRGPLPALGRPGRDGFNAVMADGSVRFVRANTEEAVLRAAVTRAGGERLPWDW